MFSTSNATLRREFQAVIPRAAHHRAHRDNRALFCWFCFELRRGLAGAAGKRIKAKRPSNGRGDPISDLIVFNHIGRPFLTLSTKCHGFA
jgi:hypothetical protein